MLAQNSRPSLPQKFEPNRKLTAREFQHLGDVLPEAEWFANLDNPRTRRAYGIDIREFMAFAGIVEARGRGPRWDKSPKKRIDSRPPQILRAVSPVRPRPPLVRPGDPSRRLPWHDLALG